jgi:hypothetical protein
MSSKRGRPLSLSDDVALQARRAAQRARSKAYYDRLRRVRDVQQSVLPSTSAQLQQGEQIITFSAINTDTPATHPELGLRVQNLLLHQDPAAEIEQVQAQIIEEHEELYLPLGDSQSSDKENEEESISDDNDNDTNDSNPGSNDRDNLSNIPGSTDSISSSSATFYSLHTASHNSSPASHSYLSHRSDTTASIPRPSSVQNIPISDQDSSLSELFHPMSEHSDQSVDLSDENTEEAIISDLDSLTQKLITLFMNGPSCCSADSHDTARLEHNQECADTHYSLQDLLTSNSVDPLPDVLSTFDSILTSQALATLPPVEPKTLRQSFCGISEEGVGDFPPKIYLHAEETQETSLQVAFDIDSYLGFMGSLAAARQGIMYQPAPQMRQNISTDIHITIPIDNTNPDTEHPQFTPTNLRDVPHFCIGRLVGAPEVSIYILFPHIAVTSNHFITLTEEQHM